ncbi:MAG: DUF4199 domain-containing protein [Janthinobacterium lividum]
MSPFTEQPTGAAADADWERVRRLAVRFGMGAGVVCAAWIVFLQLSGNNAFGPKQLLGLLAVPFAAVGSQWLLRAATAPARPGIGRTLAVGGLTVLLAATIASASTWALAHAVGTSGLTLARSEMVEIVRVEQAHRDKLKRNPQLEQQEIQQATQLPIGRLAFGTFVYTVMLGMLAAIPAGLFLRK